MGQLPVAPSAGSGWVLADTHTLTHRKGKKGRDRETSSLIVFAKGSKGTEGEGADSHLQFLCH